MNLRSHILRYHPELGEKRDLFLMAANWRTVEQAVLQPPLNSERAKWINKSIARFIAMDLRPYSVVEIEGFRGIVHTLELRYKIPSWQYFTDTAIPTLNSETKSNVLDTLMEAGRVAIHCVLHYRNSAFHQRWVAACVTCAPNKSNVRESHGRKCGWLVEEGSRWLASEWQRLRFSHRECC